MMKRYNQGFGKFGPMEQCKDGEWVRFEDSVRTTQNVIELLRECNENDLAQERDFFNNLLEEKEKELHNTKRNCNWIALAALIISIFNITEFLLRQ